MARVALTDRFVAGAKPGAAGRADYYDESSRGLTLRVAEGRKSWTLVYTSPRDGKRARVTLGSYPATSLSRARTLALEARGMVEEGEDPRSVFGEQATAGAMIMAELVESWLEKHVKGEGLRSAKEIERRLIKNVLPVIGDVKVAELHKRDINRVLDPILKRGRSVEVARVYEDIRGMLRWAVARGDLDRNPMEGMNKPGSSKPRERVLSENEIRTLWNVLPEALKKSKTCQRIIKLCLLSAQRVGEVAGMRRDELDLKAALWSLPGSRTKNKHAHSVPLSAPAIKIIEQALADAGGNSAFVFPSDDGPLPPMAVAKTIERGQERIGVGHWVAHDLRRSALTAMARLGVAPVVLAHIANHRTATKAGMTLGVYVQHDYHREKAEAINLWADRLMAIVSDKPTADVVPFEAVR